MLPRDASTLLLAATMLVAREAAAQPADDAATPRPVEPPPAAEPPPFLYSVPWQLRPLPAPTVVRLDSVFGFDEDRLSRRGTTAVSLLTASARIPGTGPPRAGIAVFLRTGLVSDSPPGGDRTWVATNLLVGAAYALRLPADLLLNFTLAMTLPTGSGGGDDPDRSAVLARSRATSVRSGFDNPILATNDMGVIPSVGFGWVSQGWTLQVEATMSHVGRVRGGRAQREVVKTNGGLGLHVGRFVTPFLSVNGELRYQRWLNPPFSVENDPSGASTDTTTVALGPRFHVKLGPLWARPGVAYVRALDKPLAAASPNLHTVQIDIPVFF